ncbi:hypothetical protein EVAR_76862_1 [Eumeta japonica]|uniref:Uncharacterized protein n=1 Tax=Eumeta variegata TaxID=151549 RepID=A0A4C1SHF6_EUMVA|nr:hypothetical protein EVAR_76862_1 [Eumeta japonica]
MPASCQLGLRTVPGDNKQMLRAGTISLVLKVTVIKVIFKPVTDDYTLPKSYRFIALLSILGKKVKKMLMVRLNWHLMSTLQGTKYGFMPQCEMGTPSTI